MITSKNNQFVKLIKELSQKKKRDESGLYLLEGKKFIADLSDAGETAEMLAVTAQYENCGIRAKEIMVVGDDIMKAISDTKTPQGMIGVYRKHVCDIADFLVEKYVLYLDGIQDSENIGALIRTAVCAGYGGVLLGSGCADCYAPKALRASAGTIARMKVKLSCPDELDKLAEENYCLIGADLGGSAHENLCAQKSVLIIGSEGGGMCSQVAAKCHRLVKIPIYGNCESLNASVAGGLLMYKIIGYY